MGWQRAVWLYGGGTIITNTYLIDILTYKN